MPPVARTQGETPDELKRRAAVERRERFRDREEQFERDRASATTDAEREKIQADFVAERTRHREEDIASGNRAPGVGVIGRQVMWLSWIDIAVRHELEARAAGTNIDPSSSALGDEFSASLVAITASALTVEALYAELKYLVPSQKLTTSGRKNKQFQIVRNTLGVAFGLTESTTQRLGSRLQSLFERRNFAVHPYSELAPLEAHPGGVMSTAELARFNAATSREAVDCAFEVLAVAASPLKPANRWVERWVGEHASSQADFVAPLRARR
ncbi:hypothetical protein IU459_15775 [Nocardia amamiensis]|uniref:Uncharacterized protein n=1 Tax=Nocardia amamiensis TaxID=404578 RepID=A0ABS0CQV0_9NOCA|nr:hypothetical protein [Nocardia amamiensis]MBF6298992.1 hypothetical protein [Nocardia amamiensis]